MASIAPFSFERTKFDQSTWAGRTRHFFAVTNPVYLFASEGQLAVAKAKLQAFRDGKRGSASDAELWEARTLTDAVLHPDTGVPVPAMFRICSFAPANMCDSKSPVRVPHGCTSCAAFALFTLAKQLCAFAVRSHCDECDALVCIAAYLAQRLYFSVRDKLSAELAQSADRDLF